MGIDFERDATVFLNELGEFVERLAIDVDGHDVQVMRFDGDDGAMLVKVDRAMRILPRAGIDGFILSRLLPVLLLGMFFMAGCSSPYRETQAISANDMATIAIADTPTATIIPSATIDYQVTAIIAQQTADEARRVNALVTAQFEQRALEQLQMTAQAEQRSQEIYGWTVTAALTSIPLTATQQAALNTQIPHEQMLLAAELTSTKEAPTQMIAMIDAQNHAIFGRADYIARTFAMIAFGVFCIGLIVFLVRLPTTPTAQAFDDEQPVAAQTETVVQMKRDLGNGDFSFSRCVTIAMLAENAPARNQASGEAVTPKNAHCEPVWS